MKTITASSLAFLLMAGATNAIAAAAGAEAFDFLLFDPSARAVGLGGAYTALAADSNALFYNPAGLARMKSHEASFMHNQYVEGLTQEHLAFAARQGWGLDVSFLNFGGIPRTRLDARDGGIGTVGLTDLSVGAGYGHTFGEWFSVGAGAKYLREKIDATTAGGFAGDLGVLATVPSLPGLSFGLAALNMGPEVRFQTAKEKLPLLGRAGVAYAFPLAKTDNALTADATKVRTDKFRFGIGAETVVDKMLALRAGFTSRNDAGLGITGGVGFIWKAMSVDYAFVPFGDLGFAHRLSLTFRWGHEEDQAREPRRAEREPTYEAPAPVESEDLRRVIYNEKLGRTSLQQGDIAHAKASFTEAIRVATSVGVKDPVLADAYAGMARCLREEGKIDYAVKFFNKALAAGPISPARLRIESELKELPASK